MHEHLLNHQATKSNHQTCFIYLRPSPTSILCLKTILIWVTHAYITLISSSCISRNSNFLFLSETESSEGSTVPTVSTTSSGREDKVATTASSGFILPDTVKALRIFLTQVRILMEVICQADIYYQKYLESIRRDDGTEWLSDRSSQSLSWIKWSV